MGAYNSITMRVLTGIQPTNILHVGNLFGALLPASRLQSGNQLYMMIADYHAITQPQDPHQLRENILFITAAYLAGGIDPKRTILFQQSQVIEHTELAWVLQCVARMGEAERMTQFKDKAGEDAARSSVGLFTYPMLMAADILLYGAEVVPVGADQKQHLELTRDLAERFNRDFGETFVVPEPQIKGPGAKILSLSDPSSKMSKSSPSAKSYLSITDAPDVIAKKIASAVTDSERGITVSDDRPGLKNLLTILSLASGTSIDDLANQYRDKGTKDLKDATTEALVSYLAPLQEKMKTLLEDRNELIEIIRLGSEAASEVAREKMKDVRKRIGVAL